MFHVGRVHGVDDHLVEPRDHLRRRLRRREHAVPAGRDQIIAGFAQRRHARQERRALPVRGGQDANAPGLGHLHQVGRGRDLDRDMPGHEIGEARGGAMVRHWTQVDLGGAAEHHAQKVRQRAGAGNGVVRVRGIGLRPIDQILERLGVGLRPDRDAEVERAQLAQRREIGDRVVVQMRIEVLIDRQRRDRRQQQGVAVGRRIFHRFDADAAIGAGAVLDNHRPVERATHFIGDQARHRIAGAACARTGR